MCFVVFSAISMILIHVKIAKNHVFCCVFSKHHKSCSCKECNKQLCFVVFSENIMSMAHAKNVKNHVFCCVFRY